MAQVEVVDNLLWTKRVHGGTDLRKKLEALADGATVRLKIAGEVGSWRKMAPNKTNGNPTPGLQPLGPAAIRWRDMFRANKTNGGALVDIEIVEGMGSSDPALSWTALRPGPSDADRAAAWQAIKDLWRTGGWRSEAPYGPRDELYDR